MLILVKFSDNSYAGNKKSPRNLAGLFLEDIKRSLCLTCDQKQFEPFEMM